VFDFAAAAAVSVSPFGNTQFFPPVGTEEERMREFLAEQRRADIDLADVVQKELWADDQLVERHAVIPQRRLVFRAFIQVIPSQRIQLLFR
jgi:2-hydroxychromene-2-carboxylate isomerase